MRTIGFLHTSPVHTARFDRLVLERAPGCRTVTVVDESLLAIARRLGVGTPQVAAAIDRAIDELVADGADTIVCTCSTVGGRAEERGLGRAFPVLRVDRPMAERAVAIGGRIGVVAALAITVEPTTALIAEVAASRGVDVSVEVWMCDRAWDRFEAGDIDGYLDAVAIVCDEAAAASDVVVLAQASMADAAPRCSTSTPVLNSPDLAMSTVLGA